MSGNREPGRCRALVSCNGYYTGRRCSRRAVIGDFCRQHDRTRRGATASLTDPDWYPGKPVATAHPDHQPVVPPMAGIAPYCTCGYVGGNGTDRPLLADHLREFDPNYGRL